MEANPEGVAQPSQPSRAQERSAQLVLQAPLTAAPGKRSGAGSPGDPEKFRPTKLRQLGRAPCARTGFQAILLSEEPPPTVATGQGPPRIGCGGPSLLKIRYGK